MEFIKVKGDIFESKADALVNAVNCVGIMGAGIAREFKRRYPHYYVSYRLNCIRGLTRLGKVNIHPKVYGDAYIIDFPTKNHYSELSKLEYVIDGIKDLSMKLNSDEHKHIKSIAFPAIACGLGGLNISDVVPIIKDGLKSHKDLTIYFYTL